MVEHPEFDRFVERLHEDAGFRHCFSRDPQACLQATELPEEEKSLLAGRDQDAWSNYALGGVPHNTCVVCVVVALTIKK